MAVKTEGQTDGLDNYRGVLYKFELNKEKNGVEITTREYNADSGYREPANFSSFKYDNDSNLTGWTKDLYQKEYNELVQSVIANGGFYIGRYETGNVIVYCENNDKKMVSQPKNEDIKGDFSRGTWYDLYKGQKNIYGEESSIKTHMIWGSQWDQVMIYLKDVKNTTKNNTFFILDSTGMGNYKPESGSGSVVATGNSPDYAVKGIYGLAGNVFDWTMEASGTYCRVERGGYYDLKASDDPASDRNTNVDPIGSGINLGSRLTLYK